MSLEYIVSFKRKLEDEYYNPKNEDVLLEAIPDDIAMQETMKFCSMLYRSDELIKELLIEEDMVSLYKYLDLYRQSLLMKYNDSGEVIRKLCKLHDYTAITVYFAKTYENVMYGEDGEIDLTNKEFCGKINMIFDFYQDILNHDFKSVFDYTKRCDYINNLCLLVESYNKSLNSNHK